MIELDGLKSNSDIKEVSRWDIFINQFSESEWEFYLTNMKIVRLRLTVKERAVQRQNKKRRKR